MFTMKDIAREAGVSLGTVSNVLNHKDNVSLKKIQLVQAAIEKLGYQKNRQAGFLKAGHTNKIAIILPNIRSFEYSSLYETLDFDLTKKGYQLGLYLTYDQPEKEKEILQLISGENIHAIISVSCMENADVYYECLNISVKDIIFVYRKLKNSISFINLDYENICYDFFKQLSNKKINKIVVFDNQHQDKKSSFSSTLATTFKSNSIPININLMTSNNNDYNASFDIIKLVEKEQIQAIITTSFEKAKYIYNAFYFSNTPPPLIYTFFDNQFINDNRFLKYHINYDLISKKIIALILKTPYDHTYKNKGFVFDAPIYHKISARPKVNILSIKSPASDALKKLTPYFYKKYGIKAYIETVSFPEIFTILNDPKKILNYDLIRIDMESLPWVATDHFIPLDFIDLKYLKQHYSDDIIDRFCLVNHKIYAIPFDPSIQMLFYRQDLFEDQVIKRDFYEKYKTDLCVPKDFEEFNRLSKFFCKKNNNNSNTNYGTSIIIGDEEILATEFLVRYYALQGTLFSDKNLKLNHSIAQIVLENMDILKPNTKLLNEKWWHKSVELFEQGKTAMLIIYINHFFHLTQNPIAPSVGFATVPGNMPLLGGGGFAITKYSQQYEESKQFLKWFLNDEIHEQYVLLGGSSARKNIFSNQEIIKNTPWLSLAYENNFKGIRENLTEDKQAVNLRGTEFIIGQVIKKWLQNKSSNASAIDEINNLLLNQQKSLLKYI